MIRTLDERTRANFFHLYADIAWFGIVAGSIMSFMNIHAVRVGGTPFQIGLLTAGPAVINLLFSLPSGRWLEKRPLIGVTFWFSLAQRVWYLLLIPLPLLLREPDQVWGLIGLTVFMSLPATVLAIAFNAMFADVVPPEWRGHVVGRRNAIVAVVMALTALACGQLLDRVPPPLNYQLVYSLGALGAMASSYHLARLRSPDETPPRLWRPLGDIAAPGNLMRLFDGLRSPGLRFLTRAQGTPLLRLDLLRSSYGAFLLAFLAFYTFQYLPSPLFPLVNVRVLNLSNTTISLGTALFHTFTFTLSLWLNRFSDRFGHRRVLVVSAFLFGMYPLLLFLAKDATLFLVASVFGGCVFAFLNGSLVNRLMERVPETDRPAHMALHNLALNLGILAGSLAGPALGDILGVRQALLVSAILRFLAALLLGIWG